MTSRKPFRTNLAQWSAEYLRDRIEENGLKVALIPEYDKTGLIVEMYHFTFRDVWMHQEYGARAKYAPYELVEAYYGEYLDRLAHRFATWVSKNIEQLKGRDNG